MRFQHPTSLRNGRFSLVHSLGSGGMASVYRAYDHELRVWRAIKLLSQEFGQRASIRTRFAAEAQTMAALEHPNVVRIYDVGVEGDTPYIVMELAEGGCIADWIDRNGPMPVRMAIDVSLQLCRGIHEAHSRGVIHRDVKPHNLLVDVQGRVKVTDFGIAQAARDGDASLTRTGTVMGTLGFMAPEQRADAKNVDARADVYAIGATMYMLLAGYPSMELFVADSNPEILEDVPAELRPVIAKACAYRPADRYQRVIELAHALMAIRKGAPVDPEDAPSLVHLLPPADPPKRISLLGQEIASQVSPVAPRPPRAPNPDSDGSTFVVPSGGSEPTRLRSQTEIEQAAMDRLTMARTRMDRSHGEETLLAPTEWLDPDAKQTRRRFSKPRGPLTDIDAEAAPVATVLVHLECGPKRRHGGGNPLNGCMAIERMLAMQRFGARMEAEAKERGLHPARVQGLYDDGTGARMWSQYDLEVGAEDLGKYDEGCASCPASRGSSYGCFVHLEHPIAVRSEAWLMDRLTRGGTLGGDLCAQMISTGGFKGREMARHRREGLFESGRPLSQVVKKGWLFNTSVDSNQIFEALLLGGDFLDPANCLGMAMWFGAVELNGVAPEDASEADITLVSRARTPEDRLARTRLRLGKRTDDPAIVAMQQVLTALYLAWVSNARLLCEP